MAVKIRIGGKTRQELDQLVETVKKSGGHLNITTEETPFGKRFQGPTQEFGVEADERAITHLLREQGVMIASCGSAGGGSDS